MHRRTILAGLAGLAGGLILPATLAETTEAARRYWVGWSPVVAPPPFTSRVSQGLFDAMAHDLLGGDPDTVLTMVVMRGPEDPRPPITTTFDANTLTWPPVGSWFCTETGRIVVPAGGPWKALAAHE